MSPSPNPRKGKERSQKPGKKTILIENPLPSDAGVSFRDEQTGGFTLNHWEAHRLTCVGPAPTIDEPAIYTPGNGPDSLSQAPAKRRRSKRTEEERIRYLGADPFVRKFEPFHVLCASCGKWLKLRSESTYCSIPWDRHRKICLARENNQDSVYSLEERNALFSKSFDVRKFDPERLLCNICGNWLSVPPDDHLKAVKIWLQHLASCQRSSGSSSAVPLQLLDQHAPGPSGSQATFQSHLPSASFALTANGASPKAYPGQPSGLELHDGPKCIAERRTARALALRADKLIGKVEPNRVFCSPCQKWILLRQDSAYCMAPWLMHRRKCHQRQKAAEIAADPKGTTSGDGPASSNIESEDGVDADAEEVHIPSKDAKQKEERHVATNEEHFMPRRSSSTRNYQPEQPHKCGHLHYEHHPHSRLHLHSPHPLPLPPQHQQHHHHKSSPLPYNYESRYPVNGSGSCISQAITAYHVNGVGGIDPRGTSSHPAYAHRAGPAGAASAGGCAGAGASARAWDEVPDGDGETEDEGNYEPQTPPPGHSGHSSQGGIPRRPWPVGLADLDSLPGRKQFIFGCIKYLYDTTFEATDDLSISALLVYLNAAMPQDKHVDFDTSEVARAVAAMKENGLLIFEGDILRLID